MVKEKLNQTRIYDEDGYRRRAACVCIKNDSENEILLVSSSRNTEQWIIPGGGLEPEEEPSVAAAREVTEEAGVVGEITRCIGVFENEERRHRTSVYLFAVKEELKEWEDSEKIGRKRKWFSMEEALDHLKMHKPVHRRYLEHLLESKTVAAN